jgi:nucleotide-binding universal stress UspA family protein
MKLLEKILVGTDFHPASESAVRVAGYVAEHFESKVYLLHAKSTGSASAAEGAPDIDQVISHRLDEMAEQLHQHGARTVESVLVEGFEFEQMDWFATQQDVNVIIVGAGEIGPDGHVYLGTTAAQLRRHASQPVWIVKPDFEPPVRRILCPVDFLPASARALKNAIHLARRFNAELTVLHVTQSPLADYRDLLAAEAPRPPAVAHEEGQVGEPTPAAPYLPQFDEFLRGFDFHDVRHGKLVRQGKARYRIVDVAREIEADLIVMGSAGRTGISRMLVGGAARRVAQELPCSVITVRSSEPIRLTVEREVPAVDVDYCDSRPPARQCERYQHGEELLTHGLPDEALAHFHECVNKYPNCAPAWKRLSAAHARLGQHEKAKACRERAEEVTRELTNRMINEEMRGQHILHRRIFGI